jgi:mRNA-degrading endonuclease RelE of RelBE toxin-antitoxin system
MSCVNLLSVSKRELVIANHDLLDGTPVLDIKPYLSYADSHPDASHGWLEESMNAPQFRIEWKKDAQDQLAFLKGEGVDFVGDVERILRETPLPYPSRRIEELENGDYRIAHKTWRLVYAVDLATHRVAVLEIQSGYDEATMRGEKASRWGDVEIHRRFNAMRLNSAH